MYVDWRAWLAFKSVTRVTKMTLVRRDSNNTQQVTLEIVLCKVNKTQRRRPHWLSCHMYLHQLLTRKVRQKICIKYMYFSVKRYKFYGTRDSFTEVNGFILPLCSKRCHKKIKILYLCDLWSARFTALIVTISLMAKQQIIFLTSKWNSNLFWKSLFL